MRDVLGIDLGGVIMDGVKEDPEAHPDPLAIRGAFAAVARLRRERFLTGCWLVSRCEADAEAELLGWLERHQFFQISEIDRRCVVFCRELCEKAEICRELDVTHFIDDRLAVLKHMIGVVPHLYQLLSRASKLEAVDGAIEGIRLVNTWAEVMDDLLDSPQRRPP
jgi:hypothetical protein